MRKLLEVETPLPLELDEFIDRLKRLDDFDAFILDECGGVSAAVVAERIRRECDKEIFLKTTCRDRNRIAIHSQLATAAAAGFTNLVLADGAHPIHTSFPEAAPVYEFDALGLLELIKGHTTGVRDTADPFLASVDWRVGVCLGDCTDADMARAKQFLAFQADLFFVLSIETIAPLRRLTELPIFLAVDCGDDGDVQGSADSATTAGASGVIVTIPTGRKGADG